MISDVEIDPAVGSEEDPIMGCVEVPKVSGKKGDEDKKEKKGTDKKFPEIGQGK